MANILSLKRRINSAKNVSKTTHVMQMIAASKLKKAQDAALSSRPYVEKLTQLSKTLSNKLEEEDIHDYMKTDSTAKSTLLIVLAPDKGLCGGLVSNLARELLQFDSHEKEVKYITVGKKIESLVSSLGKDISAAFPFGTRLPSFDFIYPIAALVNDYFLGKKVKNVKILSTVFSSLFMQTPRISTLLPIELPNDNVLPLKSDFTLFEPNSSYLLPFLLKHYLEMSIYQHLLESYVSEQAARMIAMQSATDNALEIASDLKLEYNKQRQEKITNEILDIGSASFAINYE
ncbi:MAG: ATP synthase F1 subunit gamma [Candidatus Levybacteria bacterium]|nr:ATP synthase F1 subunit gamma [Candidatus Levybacteria bacterium]